jgi:hypothetical protein
MKLALLTTTAMTSTAITWREMEVPNPVQGDCGQYVQHNTIDFDCEQMKAVWNAPVIAFAPPFVPLGPGGGDGAGSPGSGENVMPTPGTGDGPNEGDASGPGGGDTTGTPGSGDNVMPNPGGGPGPNLGDGDGAGTGNNDGNPGMGDNLPGIGSGPGAGVDISRRLLVYLPGTKGKTDQARDGFLTSIAQLNDVHIISLPYLSTPFPVATMNQLCGGHGQDEFANYTATVDECTDSHHAVMLYGSARSGIGEGLGPGTGSAEGEPGSGMNMPGQGTGNNTGNSTGPGGGDNTGDGTGINIPGAGPGPGMGDAEGPGGGNNTGIPGTGANIPVRHYWPFWNVMIPHSIQTRLYLALVNLHMEAPSEGWNLYFDAAQNVVRWDRVIASGFSQGAGHAAFLAYDKKVARGTFLSGPEDCCSFTSFMSRPWATPNDRLTAWYHNEEDLRGVIENNLAQRQMSGKVQFIPGSLVAEPQLDGLHLYTREMPSDTCGTGNREFHLVSTFDRCAPLSAVHTSGYAFEPVWQLLATGTFAADVVQPVVLTEEELALAAAEERAAIYMYALIATGIALGMSGAFIAFRPAQSSKKGLIGTSTEKLLDNQEYDDRGQVIDQSVPLQVSVHTTASHKNLP